MKSAKKGRPLYFSYTLYVFFLLGMLKLYENVSQKAFFAVFTALAILGIGHGLIVLLGFEWIYNVVQRDSFTVFKYITGGGTHLDSVIKYKEKNYASDAIIFAGHTSGIKQYYRSCHALLHITDLDAFPSVINEARACGLPVLASDLGGCSEQIVQGLTGYLFSNNDEASLLDVLEKIINPNIWEELSVNGSEYVHSNHNIGNIGESMILGINKIIQNRCKNIH